MVCINALRFLILVKLKFMHNVAIVCAFLKKAAIKCNNVKVFFFIMKASLNRIYPFCKQVKKAFKLAFG